MSKPALGILVGGGLGILDGLVIGFLLFGLVSASTAAISQSATPQSVTPADPLSPVAALVGR